ncbi:MAG: thioredoxin TrxA [Gammaproteobacteria bacterium]|nr:thioredoxin TrxA [Gammaproteobacteria bacterium]NNC97487.1 thioredoxin TrxA [Gammaproteobacteria bacterium]NNM13597.1 thioredoxin TrxA [Gammaproteobacteria bacterium]
MSDLIKHTSEADFGKDVLDSNVPVLVDFWAPWCGPCKMIAPILDAVAPDYDGKVGIVKLNIDENPSIARKYGVRGIPTLLLFRDGNVHATHIGALSQAQLTQFLDSNQ